MLKNIILLFIIFSLPFCMRGEEKCRIISLSPAVTEIICHLGGEKYLVGRSSACDYPESVKKLPVAGDFAKPYMEKILSLRPHYLLTNDLINPVVAKKLTSFGIKCIMKQTTGKDEYFFWVEIIGKILKKEKEATLEIRRVNSILSDLQKRIAGRKKKKVLWIIWDSPLMVAGEKAFPDSMIR
ncbi:MAG: ABC transporter substrate-binding protein, partial [Lentisphaeria bacterium]|nr:ABC transporter substrate-binding protein [Lentisphaeria bacterium]